MLWDAVKNGERLGGGPQYRASATDSTAPFGCSPVTNGDQRCGLVRAGALAKSLESTYAPAYPTSGHVDGSRQSARRPVKLGSNLWTVNIMAGCIMLRP